MLRKAYMTAMFGWRPLDLIVYDDHRLSATSPRPRKPEDIFKVESYTKVNIIYKRLRDERVSGMINTTFLNLGVD